MSEFRFDPPLTLNGNIVVRNLDDAVGFMIGYREARRPARQMPWRGFFEQTDRRHFSSVTAEHDN